MIRHPAFALIAVLAAAPARAQTVEQAAQTLELSAKQAGGAINEGHEKAEKERLAARVVFPIAVVCEKSAEFPQGLKLYPRLSSIQSLGQLGPGEPKTVAWQFEPEPDETAAQLDDYRAISVSRETVSYDLWSCDTQDYTFAFATADLAKPAGSAEATRKVKARASIETRGHLDYEGALSCAAEY